MSDERVNGAIDKVARQMTEAAPAGGAEFRRRVLARIDARETPRRSWRAAFVLSPIAAAMVIAIAVLAMRGGRSQPQMTSPADTTVRLPPSRDSFGGTR